MTTRLELESLKTKVAELEQKLLENSDFAKEQKLIEEAPLYNIYEWEAPDRIHVRRTSKWYNTIIISVLFAIAFAILTENYLLIIVVLSIGLFVYASTSTPPRIQKQAIANKGIRIDDKLFKWSEIDHFWVSEKNNTLIINSELKDYQGRITLLQGNGDIQKIISEMAKHEEYEEPTGLFTFISNLTDGKGKKLTDFSAESK